MVASLLASSLLAPAACVHAQDATGTPSSPAAQDAPVNASLPAARRSAETRDRVAKKRHAPVYLNSPIPPVTATARTQILHPSSSSFTLDGNANLQAGDELTIQADHITSDYGLRQIDATGNVFMQEMDTSISASALKFSATTRASSMQDVTYRHYPYTVTARNATGLAGLLDMDDATISTSPPGAPRLLRLQARKFTIDNDKRRVIGRNVSLYLGSVRVITIPRVQYKMASEQSQKQAQNRSQSIGYNSYEGAFVTAGDVLNLGPQPVGVSGVYSSTGKNSASASTSFGFKPIPIHPPGRNDMSNVATGPAALTMAEIRDSTRSGHVPVPEGDPLRFHDFTAPVPTGGLFGGPQLSINTGLHLETAYDERVYGTPINYLYVSKWPEVTLGTSIPIGAVRPDFPLGVDAVETRRILRKPEFGFYISDTDGYYKEVPTGINSTRNQFSTTLNTRSFLVAPNLLCYSGISYIHETYGISSLSQSYPQATLALERVFTDLTGIGAQVTYASVTGRTPFTFDALGAAHEFDVRGQYGNGFVVFGALLQYDLQRNAPYDTRLSIGPNLHGIMPRMTYDNLTRTTGFAIDIVGLTY